MIKDLLKSLLGLILGTPIEDDLKKNDYMILGGIAFVILLYAIFHKDNLFELGLIL